MNESVSYLRRLWEHSVWADRTLLEALERSPSDLGEAWREYQHTIAVEELWLARLEGREARADVWPKLSRADLAALSTSVQADYSRYLAELTTSSVRARIAYTNSAGETFESVVEDVLLHVAMHGQYHRGKVNLMLRQAGAEPAPVDYIGFVRGSPAAVTPPDGAWDASEE